MHSCVDVSSRIHVIFTPTFVFSNACCVRYRNNSLAGRAELRMEAEFSLGSEGDYATTRTRAFSADAAVVDWERDGIECVNPHLFCSLICSHLHSVVCATF